MVFILEVQEFEVDWHEKHPEWLGINRPGSNGVYHHIGYMNKIFKTKKEASDYYCKYNTHMRPIIKEFDWASDWDPDTYLRYVIRKFHFEFRKIPPFTIIKK